MEKKGQAAAGAAILIAVIAGLLILFILFIPPQDRAELLNEGSSSDSIISSSGSNLLTTSPGRIDYLAQKKIEHPLPVINVFTKTAPKVIAEKNVAYAKRGAFSEQISEFHFTISDLENTENVLLPLKVNLLEGRLIVELNGVEVYNSESTPGPINLPRNLLQENNLITFAVSFPGLAFWKTNEVNLQDIKVVADVTDTEARKSKSIFLVSETEKKNLEKAVLRFQPDCIYAETSKLDITINGQEVYDAVPDCDIAFVPIEFSSDLVNQGENEIIFQTERGNYILSHVVVESQLKELDFPTYYFRLSNEQYEAIQADDLRVRLELDFVDVTSVKRGSLVVNGQLRSFDTKEVSFVTDLSNDIVKGDNSLKIKPKKTVEIRQLKVDLVE